jgi:hypothetical protein
VVQTPAANIKDKLINVVNALSEDHIAEVLDFALFVQSRQAQQHSGDLVEPVQRLEDLWGDFWPEDEPVDDFIDAVRRWRREDILLHQDLQ